MHTSGTRASGTAATRLLRGLVMVNKRTCDYLTHRFPVFFSSGGIERRPASAVPDDLDYRQLLTDTITRSVSQAGSVSILEVGGFDRPLVPRSTLRRLGAASFSGLDPARPEDTSMYDAFFEQSIEEPIAALFDLVYSMTVLEHVRDNSKALSSIYHSLNPGGMSIHYVPSKSHPYSIILRAISNRVQTSLIRMLRPWAVEVTGYPAFFDQCSPAEMRRLSQRVGFTDCRVTRFYRANDYFSFLVPAFVVVTTLENLCRLLRTDWGCSGFVVELKK